MTYLLRVTSDGIATDKDGRQYRLVPVEPVAWIQKHAKHADRLFFADQIDNPLKFTWPPEVAWMPLLSAATVDLAGLAVRMEPCRDLRFHGEFRRGWNACLDNLLGFK